jgi:hypothetical protein
VLEFSIVQLYAGPFLHKARTPLARENQSRDYLPPCLTGVVSAKVKVIVISRGRSYKTEREKAILKVGRGAFSWRDNFTIVEIEPRFRVPLNDGPLGTGNAIPFSRVQNKLCAPHPIHYPIPAAGAHTRTMRCAWNNAQVAED